MFNHRINALMRMIVFVVLSITAITSCGMQGDLYLPEEKAENQEK